MKIKQLFIITITFIGTSVIQTTSSQEINPIEQAQQLIDQGNPEKAITILRKLVSPSIKTINLIKCLK